MKAWTVRDTDNQSGTVIVFAETRGKAIALAFRTDDFEDCEWTDLRARRFKEWDKYYDGEAIPDTWFNNEQRIRLVRDFGWSCLYHDYDQCEACSANQWCDKWEI